MIQIIEHGLLAAHVLFLFRIHIPFIKGFQGDVSMDEKIGWQDRWNLWWERNWWVIILLLVCFLAGTFMGYTLGNYFLG